MAGNNGNLQRQEIYIPNGPTLAQTYDYDSLNRLHSVAEDSSWRQEYVYDRYGNRTIHQTNTWGTGINKKDFTVNTANNRLGVVTLMKASHITELRARLAEARAALGLSAASYTDPNLTISDTIKSAHVQELRTRR